MKATLSLVRHNLLDQHHYEALAAESTLLGALQSDILRTAPSCEGLLADIYFLLYKKVLVFEPYGAQSLHSLILEEFAAVPGLMKLRSRTAGNRAETHIALWLMTRDLLERLRGAQWLREAAQLLDTLQDSGLSDLTTPSGTPADTPDALQDFWRGILSPQGADALAAISAAMTGESGLAEQADTLEALAEALESGTGNRQGPLPDTEALKNAAAEAESSEQALDTFLSAARDLVDPEAPNDAENAPAGGMATSESPDTGSSTGQEETGIPQKLREAARDGRGRLAGLSAGTWRGDRPPMHLPAESGPDQRRVLTEGPAPVAPPAAVGLDPSAPLSRKESTEALKHKPPTASAPTAGAAFPDAGDPLYQVHKAIGRLQAEKLFDSTAEKLDAFDTLLTHGGASPRDLDPLPFDEALGLYKRAMDPVMVQFFNRVGRKREIARLAQHRKKARRDLPVDRIRPDDDLDSIIDDELTDLALGIEAFENSFIDRFLHKSLLTRARVTKTARHKGPIVLCYDGSGSMEGDKILETKAHILAFIEVARQQKRRMVTIQFASATEPLYVRELHPHRIRLTEILELIDTFLKGGTDFERPLKEALRYLEGDRFRNGDILFITDGICDIPEPFKRRFLASKADKRFRLYSVIIHGNTYEDYGDLSDISDEVLEIRHRDLSDWNQRVSERIFSI